MIHLLDINSIQINQVVRTFDGSKALSVYKGMRTLLPVDAYPALEIEPISASNEWATTRAQRPRYSFSCTLTTMTDNQKYSVEYITTVATAVVEILTSPENLQMLVPKETKWDPVGGLWATYILDSLVEDVTYNAEKEGSLRRCEFTWFAVIHEPFPDSKFKIGESNSPSVLRPKLIP